MLSFFPTLWDRNSSFQTLRITRQNSFIPKFVKSLRHWSYSLGFHAGFKDTSQPCQPILDGRYLNTGKYEHFQEIFNMYVSYVLTKFFITFLFLIFTLDRIHNHLSNLKIFVKCWLISEHNYQSWQHLSKKQWKHSGWIILILHIETAQNYLNLK